MTASGVCHCEERTDEAISVTNRLKKLIYLRQSRDLRPIDRGAARPYGARRSGRGGRDRMVSVALPQMSEGGPPDPLARLGERLARARSTRGGEPVAGP